MTIRTEQLRKQNKKATSAGNGSRLLKKEDGKEDRKKNQAMSVPSSRVGSLDGSKPETMYTTRRAADTA